MAYAIFDTPAIHGIPGIKELAQACGELVPPPVIATAQLLPPGGPGAAVGDVSTARGHHQSNYQRHGPDEEVN